MYNSTQYNQYKTILEKYFVQNAIYIYLIPNLSKSASMMVSFFLEFTGLFIVSYLVDYIWGEHSVKQYNKIINEFDD